MHVKGRRARNYLAKVRGMGRMVALLRAVNVGRAQAADGRAARALRRARLAGRRHLHPERQCRLHGRRQAGRAREARSRTAIAERFGFDVPVDRPHRRAMGRLSARQSLPGGGARRAQPADAAPLEAAAAPRRAETSSRPAPPPASRSRRAGDALWIHFPNGAGTSKLTPGADRPAIGSPATSRNYRTVLTLKEMLNA